MSKYGAQQAQPAVVQRSVNHVATGIDDVTGVTVHNGVTEVKTLGAADAMYYVLNKDGDKVVAVVVTNDSDAANTANLLYVQKVTNYSNNADGKRVAIFTAYIDGVKAENCQYTKESLTPGFYTYNKDANTGVYSLTTYTKNGLDKKATSIKIDEQIIGADKTAIAGDILSDTYFKSESSVNGGGSTAVLNAKDAQVIDLYTDDGVSINSLKDMRTALNDGAVNAKTGKTITGFTVSYIYNGSDNSDSGKVAYMQT